ncbi:uncharacterized protein LOC126175257 [Schistocerca cancellata]|uniref:uncharacterized protein LOC126175257 n=1 Tax=Schistocerca cancellata TaxID=274614 RepID=UPI002119B407|nr:uncharacterized protein LOC126175257 [Schistocerca cancellata]
MSRRAVGRCGSPWTSQHGMAADTAALFFVVAAAACTHAYDADAQTHLQLQPDFAADAPDYATLRGSCTRRCRLGDARTCHYRFVLEHYHTMNAACGGCPSNQTACFAPQCVAADGVERGFIAVNRRLPGPSIQVCEGDRVVVDVENRLAGHSTAIHWHGALQRFSPHMDGAPGVTQCAIPAATSFRYDFVADTPGTHFWHSHDGVQKLEGVVGALVVRQARSRDPWLSARLYDHDLPAHVVVVTDWLRTAADHRLPGLRKRRAGQNPDAFLINGRGIVTDSVPGPSLASLVRPLEPWLVEAALAAVPPGRQRPWPQAPLARLHVAAGRRYRLRLIAATCLVCPFRFSVQHHRLSVIAADGAPVHPRTVDGVVMWPGERYDVVLEASQPPAAYWVLVQGLGPCAPLRLYQLATLQYEGASSRPLTRDPGYAGFASADAYAAPARMRPFDTPPHLRLAVSFGFHFFSAGRLFAPGVYRRYFQPPLPVLVAGTMNNVSFVTPGSPLLTQLDDLPRGALCSGVGEGRSFAECTHVVRLPLGATVDLLLIDQSPVMGGLSHPFHMHGLRAWVLEEGVGPPPAAEQWLPRSGAPPSKDTVAVPAGGYVRLRLLADNPGFWLMHCHFVYHQLSGMELVLQVGELEEMAPPPPGFPTCGDYLPPV